LRVHVICLPTCYPASSFCFRFCHSLDHRWLWGGCPYSPFSVYRRLVHRWNDRYTGRKHTL